MGRRLLRRDGMRCGFIGRWWLGWRRVIFRICHAAHVSKPHGANKYSTHDELVDDEIR